ncbi:MAG: GspH/FimT family pseudopilin [Hylemonella sp.]|nr:GspH/FimT family pseudopilin [Hylemonella sp.]MDH5709081.1 GspH/FimT family pseudopilin [Hylemonella sp.]
MSRNRFTSTHLLRPSRRVGGFTLIELMIVVGMMAVILGLAVPSFQSFIVGQRVKTASFSFASAAVLTRSEAIKRNQDVVLTAAAGGWKDGWSVSVGGTVLSQQEGFPGGVVFSGAVTQVTYQSTGRLAAAPGDFQISGEAASHARCISFDLSGLPKSRMGACP